MGSHHPIRKTVVPEPVAIPDKLYFRIGDVARLCDVPAYVLRFWETEFPQLKPNKGGTGQRLYRRKDVEMALRIKSLLYDQGYTIPGARQILKTNDPAILSGAPKPSEAAQSKDTEGLHLAENVSTFPAPTSNSTTPQLLALRDELRALAAQLSGPASANTAEKPRPRLVLEPKPKPAPRPTKLTPQLVIEQRDLFGE